MKSLFFNEWVAGFSQPYYLPISTVCNSDCIFCTNKYNIFPCKSGLFRDIEDIKLQLSLMKSHRAAINLSSVLPGRLPEGEAFLHPDFFEILDVIREKYPSNVLNVSSNCSAINKQFLKKLSYYNPVKIIASLHTTDPEKLAFIYNRPISFAKKSLEAIRCFKGYQIKLSGAILPMPELLGWKDIEKTAQYFLANSAKELIFHYPGYTKNTPKYITEIIECDLYEFTEFTYRLRNKYNVKIYAYPDMKMPINIPINKITSQLLSLALIRKNKAFINILWLTSEAAYPRLKKQNKKFDFKQISHNLYPVKNRSFEGNVIVGGLLLVDDFIKAGKEALQKFPKIDMILIPTAPFDAFKRDLLYIPAQKIADKLKINIALIDNNGLIFSLCRH